MRACLYISKRYIYIYSIYVYSAHSLYSVRTYSLCIAACLLATGSSSLIASVVFAGLYRPVLGANICIKICRHLPLVVVVVVVAVVHSFLFCWLRENSRDVFLRPFSSLHSPRIATPRRQLLPMFGPSRFVRRLYMDGPVCAVV